MKNNYYCILLFFAFVDLASCSTPIYMYAPAAENIPATTQKGEGTFTASYSGGLDLQGNYALSNHFGLFAGWYFRSPTEDYYYPNRSSNPLPDNQTHDQVDYHRHQFSFGGFYYTPFGKKKLFYFSLLGGYGLGYLSINEHHLVKYKDSNVLVTSTDTSYRYTANTHRFQIQPALMYASKNRFFKVVLAFRWPFIRHTSVHNEFHQGDIRLTPDKWYTFTEYAYSLIFNPQDIKWLGFRLQFGGSVNKHVPFDYRSFIGNIGVVIYPYKWWQK